MMDFCNGSGTVCL